MPKSVRINDAAKINAAILRRITRSNWGEFLLKLPAGVFGQVFASETALMENGQFTGRRIRELSSEKIVLLSNYYAIKVEEGLRY